MLELNDTNFKKEVLETNKVVVVDFWAPWCNPCLTLAPTFEKLSLEFKDKAKFAKLNVQDNDGLSQKYGIRGIPCIVVFKEGKEIGRVVGAFPENAFKEKLNSIVK